MKIKSNAKVIGIALRGMAMGIAEIIPGVSGGTIAFITGIYERLLNSISAFDLELLKTLKQSGIKAAWTKIDGNFLLQLVAGMFLGIVLGVSLISYLIVNYPIPLWGFFFGLIAASVIYVGNQVKSWGIKEIVVFILLTALSYIIVGLSPSSGNESLWYVFVCGMIAISAMLLPGISGSFILLLMGMYSFIIQDNLKVLIHDFDLSKIKVLGVFGIGCLVGIMTISRLLSYTFKYYRNTTLAGLTGIILGSLVKIWPWRQAEVWMDKITGELITDGDLLVGVNIHESNFKVISEINVLPQNFVGDAFIIPTVVTILVGFVLVFVLSGMSKEQAELN